MSQCRLIYPVWVQAGWVQWHGTPNRERLFATERRQCTGEVVEPITSGGLTFHLCAEHAAEVKAGKLFAWDTPNKSEGER